MEKGQSEVTNKIRSAIKKKLAEINDFDDVLPEYIMILVANQRSKAQFENDLSVFLGDDTVNFTNWLWDLLNNLKVCSKNIQSPTAKDEADIKKEVETDEDAVILDFDPSEHGADFLCHEDTNDTVLSKSSVRNLTVQGNEIKEPVRKPAENNKLVEKGKASPKSSVKNRKTVLNQNTKETLSSAVIPVKKNSITEGEYDPTKPEYKKPSYSLSSRNQGGPAALQANKLLQKAVNDATKSILNGKKMEDFYKPTPIKVLSSKQIRRRDDSPQKNRIFVCKTTSDEKLTYNVPALSEFDASEYPLDILMEETDTNEISNNSDIVSLKRIPIITDISRMETVSDYNCEYSCPTVEVVRPQSPHFIVTLDGVNKTVFKRKFEEDSVDSMEDYEDSDKEEEIPAAEIVSSPEKKVKLNERCKYWPACKNSDQCSYHHPTVACKCFPDCKFGDKCLYIHPNCKFDALCSRKDCPFTHASKRKLPFVAVPVKMVPVRNHRMKAVCKFYPKCTSRNCPFIHPKLCRYGTECRLPACLYGHFPVPSRSQMKWQASVL